MRKLHLDVDRKKLTRSALVCRSRRNELILALIADILHSSVERRDYPRSLALGNSRPFVDSALGTLNHMGAG